MTLAFKEPIVLGGSVDIKICRADGLLLTYQGLNIQHEVLEWNRHGRQASDGKHSDGLLTAGSQWTQDLGGLLLAPAERADVIIDFSVYSAGTEVTVLNNAPAPFPGGGETALNKIMQFKVMDAEGWPYPVPNRLCPLPAFKPAIKTRYMTLVDYGSPLPGYPPPPDTYPYPTLLLNNVRWIDPPTENPKAGSTEIWNLINLAPDTHPIHIHQTQFRILDRQDFDLEQYLATYGVDGPLEYPDVPFTGPPVPPYAHEDGLKDTVRSNPGQVTRIEIPFGQFTGRFVWHCHMLGHEDNEMMRPLFIV